MAEFNNEEEARAFLLEGTPQVRLRDDRTGEVTRFNPQRGESERQSRQALQTAVGDTAEGIPEKPLAKVPLVSDPASMFASPDTRSMAKRGDEGALNVLGRREGVPFDVESGAGFYGRLAEAMTYNREQATAMFRMMPNVENVRFNQLGEPILTVKDAQTGEVKDILANPVGIDSGDFAFVAANVPEILVGGLAAKGVKFAPGTAKGLKKIAQAFLSTKKVLPAATRMAVAGQAAGGIKDIGIRPLLDIPNSEFGEIASERGKMAMVDFVFGVGAGLIGKAASRVRTPTSSRGPLQVDADNAAEFFQDWSKKTGVPLDFQRTIGEMTGVPFYQRSEAFMRVKPGSSVAFEQMDKARISSINKVWNTLMGRDPDLLPQTDKNLLAVGEDAVETLKGKLAFDDAISRETQNLLRTSSDELLDSINRATGSAMPQADSAVGFRLSEKAHSLYEQFQSKSRELYAKVNDHPSIAGQGRNIDITPLADDAQKILDEVAAVERQVSRPVGELTDQFGRPITQEVTETTPFTGFVEGGAMTKLRQLAGAKDGKIALRDLIELRRDVDDELFRGSQIAGIPERRLSEIRSAITDRIKGGLNELDKSGKLLKSWEEANSFHAENIRKFKEIDIVEMFKGPQQKGVLGFNETVSRALSDPDRYRSYRDFFGTDSDEMKLVRRAFADRVLGRLPGDTVVDGQQFLSRLDSALQGNTREIAEDVFGTTVTDLRGLARVASKAKMGNLDVDELTSALSSKSLTRQKFESLVNAQTARDKEFQNSLKKKIAKGIEGTEGIQPSEFVNKVVFKGEPNEVRELIGMLSDQPALQDDIRQHTLMRLYNDAQDISTVGKERTSGVTLASILNDQKTAANLEAVLGSDTVRVLRSLSDVIKPGEAAQTVFKSAGGISAGQQVSKIEQNILDPTTMGGEISRILKSFLFASIYKYPKVRNSIADIRLADPADRAAFVNMFITAEPFVEDFVKVFGSEHGRIGRIGAIELKQGFDNQVRQGSVSLPQGGFDSAEEAKEFLRE